MSEELLTTAEVAKRLGLTLRAVQKMIESERLEAKKIGRDYVVRADALDRIARVSAAGRPRKAERNDLIHFLILARDFSRATQLPSGFYIFNGTPPQPAHESIVQKALKYGLVVEEKEEPGKQKTSSNLHVFKLTNAGETFIDQQG
jgi:excisionase family DNA binding protein